MSKPTIQRVSFSTPFATFREKTKTDHGERFTEFLVKQQTVAQEMLRVEVEKKTLARTYSLYKHSLGKVPIAKLEELLVVEPNGRINCDSKKKSKTWDILGADEQISFLTMTTILSLGISGNQNERAFLAKVLTAAIDEEQEETE